MVKVHQHRGTRSLPPSHYPTSTRVKLNGRPAADQWKEHHVVLEELVLAYLSRPSSDGFVKPEPLETAKLQ
jgi:hypothetical protein